MRAHRSQNIYRPGNFLYLAAFALLSITYHIDVEIIHMNFFLLSHRVRDVYDKNFTLEWGKNILKQNN